MQDGRATMILLIGLDMGLSEWETKIDRTI